MKYLYLLLDGISVLVPFVFSFHPKLLFWRRWEQVIPALCITALVFTLWDMAYTAAGVWGFNPAYLCGISFFNLPLEEVLFFLCIPYACLFTYHCLNLLVPRPFLIKYEQLLTPVLIFILLAIAACHAQQMYTLAACGGLGLALLVIRYLFKAPWLGRFYFAYLVLLIPFFVVNGILTGTGIDQPVVWYNNEENMGLRVLTIPAEDFFYGMLLILINTFLLEFFTNADTGGETVSAN